ncbi:tetratricopeptide repeat protein 36 [Periplaneta americana]|uniref:tetratricopeptide repeat protein 36 n=1 Tax=Periplaneta americana TaxID=6978 RepID=UPI0037E7815E
MSSEQDRAILNCIFNPLLPVGECVYDEELPSDLQDVEDIPNVEVAKSLEIEGVKAAESGDLDTAVGIFTRAISVAPKWASGYNNRAQVYRLKGNTPAAVADLNEAINLSGAKGKSGCQALCQRGIMHRKDGNDDLARKDFEVAAKLGSQFAKMQLVELNPYAALCNQMLHDVMTKLQEAGQT